MIEWNSTLYRRAYSAIFTIGFGVGIFLFFGLGYNGHLHLAESSRLFEMTWSQFIGEMLHPEALSTWLSGFTTQWFYSSTWGALSTAILLCLIQILCHSITRAITEESHAWHYPLSFGLPIATTMFLLYYEATYSFVWALIIMLLFATWHLRLSKANRQIGTYALFATIPLLFWLAGGVTILYVACVIAYQLFITKEYSFKSIVLYVMAVVWCLLQAAMWQYVFYYSIEAIEWGVSYYRAPEYVGWEQKVVYVTFVGFIAAIIMLRNVRIGRVADIVVAALLTIGVALSGEYVINTYKETANEQFLKLDHWVSDGNWDAIIKTSKSVVPQSKMEVACMCLAYAQRGMLPYYIQELKPSTPAALVTESPLNYVLPHHMAEVWFQLGFVNTAQRFEVEALNATPDRRANARTYQYLAESNIINGNDKIADKYLNHLHKTLHYKNWQPDEKRVEKGRALVPDTTYLHVEMPILKRLKLQFEAHPESVLIRDYYMCYALLSKDVDGFVDAAIRAFAGKRDELPVIYQEAFAFGWIAMQNKSVDQMPLNINMAVVKQLMSFMTIYEKSKDKQNLQMFASTYWYYLTF